jgi:radical SAM protein with 4Fe4S-binding SPASM domain
MDQPNRGSFLNELKKLDNIKISNIGLHNFGNGRDYQKSKKLLCDRAIKRNLLQVSWDLDIVPCCFDYNSEEKWGNLRTHSIKEIFINDRSTKFVKDHCEENADVYSICKNCTMRCSTKIS